jgi:hypothetical protein
MMKCCFDKRVWIGAGVLAAALLLTDPRLGWAALPVLAGLACPVSMVLMMRRMGSDQARGTDPADGGRAAEIARLRQEIDQLRRDSGATGTGRDDQPGQALAASRRGAGTRPG